MDTDMMDIDSNSITVPPLLLTPQPWPGSDISTHVIDFAALSRQGKIISWLFTLLGVPQISKLDPLLSHPVTNDISTAQSSSSSFKLYRTWSPIVASAIFRHWDYCLLLFAYDLKLHLPVCEVLPPGLLVSSSLFLYTGESVVMLSNWSVLSVSYKPLDLPPCELAVGMKENRGFSSHSQVLAIF